MTLIASVVVRFRAIAATAAVCAGATLAVLAAGDRVPSGEWGGDRVGLSVTEQGARAEFDCAFAEINQPLLIDAHGRFDVPGTYAQQRGPAREGGPQRRPARFAGQLSGDSLLFKVSLTESNESVGSFTVVRGRAPSGVRTCR
jgi:hypothetical protein